MIFLEKYEYVGRLLKPGEVPTNYSDEEEEGSQQEVESKSKYDWPLEGAMQTNYIFEKKTYVSIKSGNYDTQKQLQTFIRMLYYIANNNVYRYILFIII